MAAFRSVSSSLLPKAVETASAAPDSTPITVRSGHVHLGVGCKLLALAIDLHPRCYVLLSLNVRVQVHEDALTLRVHRLKGRRQYWVEFTDLFLVTPHGAIATHTGVSRRYAVAQPYPEGLEMEVGDEGGSQEEVVEGCRVRHGELWNGDVRIHYVECGDKDGELFQALAEAGYHVVAPDLRGYNTSSKPKSILDYGRRSVVSDMVRLIDELGDGKPAMVVGHDWGGFVTWAVAEDFPDKVKKAVIANVPHLSVFSAAVRSSFQQIRRSCFKILKTVLSNSSFQPLDIDRHVRAFQKVGAITGAINYYRAAVRGYWSPAPSPVPVELPVNLIWGELDTFLGKELAVISNTIASNVVIKLLPHCSHWPMWDDPKQFNALLLESDDTHHAISVDEVHNNDSVSADEGLVA